jgi:hypothetical protein
VIEVLLAVPYEATSSLFKYKNSGLMLRELSRHGKITASDLAGKALVGVKTAWSLLRSLQRVECVARDGGFFRATGALQEDSIVINLRDSFYDDIFRYAITRRVLLYLATKKHKSFAEMARDLQTPYVTCIAVVNLLRRSGLVTNHGLREGLLREASSPLQLIPRSIHRSAIEHFLQALETYYSGFEEPIILFGDASWGKPSLSIEIMGLSELSAPPEKFYVFTRALANAASVVTSAFGASIELSVSTRDAWLAQKLKIVRNPHPTLAKAFEGICIHGSLPTLANLYELMNRTRPIEKEKLEEWLQKGYVEREREGRYVFTEKALTQLQKKPSETFEDEIRVEGKKISLIGVKPPEP